jgi:hypothetical protein
MRFSWRPFCEDIGQDLGEALARRSCVEIKLSEMFFHEYNILKISC